MLWKFHKNCSAHFENSQNDPNSCNVNWRNVELAQDDLCGKHSRFIFGIFVCFSYEGIRGSVVEQWEVGQWVCGSNPGLSNFFFVNFDKVEKWTTRHLFLFFCYPYHKMNIKNWFWNEKFMQMCQFISQYEGFFSAKCSSWTSFACQCFCISDNLKYVYKNELSTHFLSIYENSTFIRFDLIHFQLNHSFTFLH